MNRMSTADIHNSSSRSPSSPLNSDNSSSTNVYPIVIFGGAKTGKSSIVKQFLYQTFDTEYRSTIEDVHNRKYEVNGRPLDIQIIDTGGLYNFPAMRKLCIRKAAGIVLVFSLVDATSLSFLTEIVEQINSTFITNPTNIADTATSTTDEGTTAGPNAATVPDKTNDVAASSLPIVILGNKLDLVNSDIGSVGDEEIQQWLNLVNIPEDHYFPSSAKEEDGIWDAFTCLYHQFIQYYHIRDDNATDCSYVETGDSKRKMVNNIRRLSAFAALAVSPSQFRTFFGSHNNPELVKSSSTASTSSSSSITTATSVSQSNNHNNNNNSSSNNNNNNNNTNFNPRSVSPNPNARFKRNSRPSIAARMSKDHSKPSKIKEPIKIDCVLS